MPSGSGRVAADRLRETLLSGRFVVIAELECPRNASATNVERQARAYAPYVDAVDCTDNSAAIVRMSPVAAASIVGSAGLTPLVQLTCRDRNQLALQSEVLGAAAVGAAGIVCLGGDPPETGNHPNAKGVYDVTTVELIAMVRGLTEGRLRSGASLDPPPKLLIGCVENPADGEHSVARLAAKVEAGADFVQTQITFDLEIFERWLARVRAARLHERVRILVGIAPVRRLEIARRLNDHVPGVRIAPSILARLECAADPEAEGLDVAAEVLRSARDISGVAGAHLMTFGWVDGVRRLVDLI